MPNGDEYQLHIKGIKITALPDEKIIPSKKIGKNNYMYTINLKGIPKDKKYLTIEIIKEYI